MIKVDTYAKMMDLLYGYVKDVLECESIRQTMDGLRSSAFTDEPRGATVPKDVQYNRSLARIDELEERIRFVQDSVDALKDINEDYYRIINHKWLIEYHNGHPSLEYIAENILYIDRSTFFRHKLYTKAKDELLFIMRRSDTECDC